jgi:hypothetical protein
LTSAAARVAAACLPLACASCNPDPPAIPDDVVLVADGIEVRAADVEPLSDYLATTGENLGHRYRAFVALDRQVLPVALARRAFGAERERLRANAEAFRRVLGNEGYPGLVSRGKLLSGFGDELVDRSAMDLPAAAWCFREENVGEVSPVLEVPQGFVVIATAEHVPGLTRAEDRVHAYMVPFFTHSSREFTEWLHEARKALVGRVSYVHKDWVDSLPAWLKVKP